MLGEKYGMTNEDWIVAESRGLKPKTVLGRLRRLKGDKDKALQPLHEEKRKQLKLERIRSTRLSAEVDRLLVERSLSENTTVSDLIAKAVIEYLS